MHTHSILNADPRTLARLLNMDWLCKPAPEPRPGCDMVLTDDTAPDEVARFIAERVVETRDVHPDELLLRKLGNRNVWPKRWVVTKSVVTVDVLPLWESRHAECRATPCGGECTLSDDDAGELSLLVTLVEVDCENKTATYCVEVDR